MFGFLKATNNALQFELNNLRRPLFIGRDKANDIVLPSANKSISNRHARIEFIPLPDDATSSRLSSSHGEKKYFCIIRDLYSTNGTFVNGVKISSSSPVALQNYDVIRFGFDNRHYMITFSSLVRSTDSSSVSDYLKSRIQQADDADERLTADMASLEKTQLYKSPSRSTIRLTASSGTPTRAEELVEELEKRVDSLESRREPQLSIVQKALLSDVSFLAASVKNKTLRLNYSRGSSVEEISANVDKAYSEDILELLQFTRENLQQTSKELDTALIEDTRKMRLLEGGAQLEKKYDSLEQYSHSLEKKLADFRVKLWDAEQKIISSEKSNEVLSKEKSSCNEMIDTLIVDKGRLNKRVTELEELLADRNAEIRQLSKDLEFYRDTSTHLERQNGELKHNNSKLKAFLSEKKDALHNLQRSIEDVARDQM